LLSSFAAVATMAVAVVLDAVAVLDVAAKPLK